MEEQNPSSFPFAEDMPLPQIHSPPLSDLYFMMSIIFLLSGISWLVLLSQSKYPVFKIHYLMGILVFLRALSLAFHGMKCYYSQRWTTWAVLFYIANLLVGVLLGIMLVLIGAGWNFMKRDLTSRERKLFMVIILLQVLAKVAEIILEESEEGDRKYAAWKNFVMFVDLLYCLCLLLPTIWSVRHLKRISQTTESLKKRKLFTHFYIMIVCYIYTTRIIVYLLKITVPLHYEWPHMLREMSTYIFFVLTAYKFRPNDDLKVYVEESKKVLLHQHTEVTEKEKDVSLLVQ